MLERLRHLVAANNGAAGALAGWRAGGVVPGRPAGCAPGAVRRRDGGWRKRVSKISRCHRAYDDAGDLLSPDHLGDRRVPVLRYPIHYDRRHRPAIQYAAVLLDLSL